MVAQSGTRVKARDPVAAARTGRDGAEPGDDARAAAIGATLACLALDETRRLALTGCLNAAALRTAGRR
jgi:hypothetical protein